MLSEIKIGTGPLDNVDADTCIAYATSMAKVEEDGSLTVEIDGFTITSDLKAEILSKINEAYSNGVKEPFVLVPQKKIKGGDRVEHFPNPLVLLGHKLFITPSIEEILVYSYE